MEHYFPTCGRAFFVILPHHLGDFSCYALKSLKLIKRKGIASRFDESLGQPASSTPERIGHCRISYVFTPEFREYIGGKDSPYYPILGRKRHNLIITTMCLYKKTLLIQNIYLIRKTDIIHRNVQMKDSDI